MNTLDQAIFITDDDSIKLLLCENQVMIPPPTPPNDVAFTAIQDGKRKQIWLVMRFFQTGDDGYTALGLPLNTPHAHVLEVWNMLLEPYRNKPLTYVELPGLAVN